MRLEASLCPVPHNATILAWKMGKYDHIAKEVSLPYTGEVNKKGKSQQAVKLANDTWKASY